jgi:hypothetical protein
MKTIAKILTIAFIICLGSPFLANAVSPSPIPGERAEKAAKGIKVKGAFVCLFQSGTADVKKEINVNDILTVYREDRDRQLKEVGKIRVLSYVGEDYLKGEVVEGELMPGDIARKGEVASLVISTDDKCK